MTRSKSDAAANRVLMTPSEARAEAAYIVLQAVLSRVSASELTMLSAISTLAAEQTRIPAVQEEVAELFPDLSRVKLVAR